MSGLTLGLLSLDRLDLEVMLRTGNKKQQKFAKRLFPMVEQPHWVLSTLVITNTVGKRRRHILGSEGRIKESPALAAATAD